MDKVTTADGLLQSLRETNDANGKGPSAFGTVAQMVRIKALAEAIYTNVDAAHETYQQFGPQMAQGNVWTLRRLAIELGTVADTLGAKIDGEVSQTRAAA